MADNTMDEILASDDEMLAQAIALSLEEGSGESPQQYHHNQAPLVMRSNTTQSTDSAILEGSVAGQQSRQISHVGTTSTSSSPDLGISAESEMESISREQESDSRNENPGGSQNQNRNVGGGSGANGSQNGARPGLQLPFVRLSSLHEMGVSPDGGGLRADVNPLGKDWVPNKDCLELIIGMGISENAAKRALYYTGNDNAELAVAWVFENIGNPDLHEPFQPPSMISLLGQGSQISPGPVYHSFDEMLPGMIMEEDDRYKMVFVVNNELKMTTGKIAAQVGHATLGLYQFLRDNQEFKEGLTKWEKGGCKKIVLKGNDVRHLLDLKKQAYELHIANIMVHDAGKTQVEPGSLTVFAVFGKNDQVDKLTGTLKLL